MGQHNMRLLFHKPSLPWTWHIQNIYSKYMQSPWFKTCPHYFPAKLLVWRKRWHGLGWGWGWWELYLDIRSWLSVRLPAPWQPASIAWGEPALYIEQIDLACCSFTSHCLPLVYTALVSLWKKIKSGFLETKLFFHKIFFRPSSFEESCLAALHPHNNTMR